MVNKLEAERQDLIQQGWKEGIPYPEYRILVENHAKSFTSTGHTQTESLSNYTVLNNRRMKRWDKTLQFTPDQEAQVKAFTKPLKWLVITESWCGDAAPTLPVMYKIASLASQIAFKIVLRDDHPQLMDAFLTNGNQSIPKLIIQDAQTDNLITSWGPRPSTATQMVNNYKQEHGALSPEFKESLQVWYNTDKGQTTVKDLLDLLQAIETSPEIQK